VPDTDKKPEPGKKKKRKNKGRELIECLLVAGALATFISRGAELLVTASRRDQIG